MSTTIGILNAICARITLTAPSDIPKNVNKMSNDAPIITSGETIIILLIFKSDVRIL